MTIIIKKNSTIKEVKNSLKKIIKTEKKGLRKHFGKSENHIDAVEFQKKIRDEWN